MSAGFNMTIPSAAAIRLWSVTTLIDEALGKSYGLVRHIETEAIATTIDQLGIVSKIVAEATRDDAVEYVRSARWRAGEAARNRGTAFHTAAQALALGTTPLVEPHIRPYVDQLERWLDAYQPEFLMAESPVYCPSYEYAGTLDGTMRLGGAPLPFLFDYKTTEHSPTSEKSRPPFPEVALQMCAYSRAELVGLLAERHYEQGKRYYAFDPTKKHEPMPEVNREIALAIVVSPYDCIAVPTRIGDDVWEAFRTVVRCAYWKIETARSLFGHPFEAPPVQAAAV